SFSRPDDARTTPPPRSTRQGLAHLLHRDGLVAVEDLPYAVELVIQARVHGDGRVAAAYAAREILSLAVVLSVLIEQRVEVVGDARDEGITGLRIRLPGLQERGQLHPVRRNAVSYELGADTFRDAVVVKKCHDNGCHTPPNGRRRTRFRTGCDSRHVRVAGMPTAAPVQL